MKKCRSEEVALKGFFLGPQAENQEWVQEQMEALFASWFRWRSNFRPEDGRAISDENMQTPEYINLKRRTESVLEQLAARFEGEIPKFSPRYIGHMFSEMSLPALFGHILTLLHNPNNISGESSKVGVRVEEEAISALAEMIGFQNGIGHFTSGGTIANFEALYRARSRCYAWLSSGLEQGKTSTFESAAQGWERYKFSDQFNPLEGHFFEVVAKISSRTGRAFMGPVMLVPQHKHYSWVKAANVFGLGADALWAVRLNSQGHLDVKDLERLIFKAHEEDRPIAMIVSVLGTTELGVIDPIHDVESLLEKLKAERNWYFWHHIDAAYGGFLCSLKGKNQSVSGCLSTESLAAIEAVSFATSLTIDPHKLGYVPYSSGAFIANDPRDYYQRSFGGPYVDFSTQTDKGPFTLEGSRSAAGAVATWMTAQCVGFDQEGYGQIIARTIRLRQNLERKLREQVPMVQLAPDVDSNLMGFCAALPGESLSIVNKRTLQLYESFEKGKESEFYLSKTTLYRKNCPDYFDKYMKNWQGVRDCDELLLIRICIMNPFFESIEMNFNFSDLFVDAVARHLSTTARVEVDFSR